MCFYTMQCYHSPLRLSIIIQNHIGAALQDHFQFRCHLYTYGFLRAGVRSASADSMLRYLRTLANALHAQFDSNTWEQVQPLHSHLEIGSVPALRQIISELLSHARHSSQSSLRLPILWSRSRMYFPESCFAVIFAVSQQCTVPPIYFTNKAKQRSVNFWSTV